MILRIGQEKLTQLKLTEKNNAKHRAKHQQSVRHYQRLSTIYVTGVTPKKEEGKRKGGEGKREREGEGKRERQTEREATCED